MGWIIKLSLLGMLFGVIFLSIIWLSEGITPENLLAVMFLLILFGVIALILLKTDWEPSKTDSIGTPKTTTGFL